MAVVNVDLYELVQGFARGAERSMQSCQRVRMLELLFALQQSQCWCLGGAGRPASLLLAYLPYCARSLLPVSFQTPRRQTQRPDHRVQLQQLTYVGNFCSIIVPVVTSPVLWALAVSYAFNSLVRTAIVDWAPTTVRTLGYAGMAHL